MKAEGGRMKAEVGEPLSHPASFRLGPPEITRREVLAAFLGLPAAIAGCSSGPGPPPIAGEIVGSSVDLGHRLRDAGNWSLPEDRWQRVGVLIVGGGIAGLSAAWRLRQAGFDDFLLVELEPEPGGTSRSGAGAISAYPWGAHYIPAPMKENRLLITLLDEMGVLEGQDGEGEPIVAEQVLCHDPQERLFYKGRWYEGLYLHAGETPEDREQFAAFHAEIDCWVAWRDGRGRRAFALPIATGSDDAEVTALDRLTMAEWLDRHQFHSSRLRWLANYACRDDYGTTIDDTSAWAGIFYFASRQRKPGIEAQPLMTWPEGNGRVVNHLYRRVAERVRLGLAVVDIRPTRQDSRPIVEVIALDDSKDELVGFRTDRVIFAAPQFLARHILRPWRDQPPRHLADFEYGAWLVANLRLRDRPRGDNPQGVPASSSGRHGFPLAWDNVLYESPSLGYVVATHQMCLDRGPTIFTWYYPLCDSNPREARARLLSLDWQAAADIALTDLGRAHRDIRSLVERLDVMRWGHAMIRPRPGFIWGPSRTAAALPYRGIHFASSDVSGVGLFEEALYHGTRAAEEVLAARGLAFQSLR